VENKEEELKLNTQDSLLENVSDTALLNSKKLNLLDLSLLKTKMEALAFMEKH
jgi:hypothetical protein